MLIGRLSIREDEVATIIANEIKDFSNVKGQKLLVIDITDASEEQKDKLRGAIKYFNGDKNNINICVKIGEDVKPCGQIYLTEEILKIFEEIMGKEKVNL